MSTPALSRLAVRLGEGLPGEVDWVARTLEDAGFETWAVGGAVRDAVLERPGGDWDLATRARPADVQRIFRRTVPIGVEYGTVGVLGRSGVLHEVTTFRRDVETFGRRAVVAFADRIEDDLSRRDFSMNAIAWRPRTGDIVDPFDGVGDLAAGRLKAVGDPAERFSEDYLRILRALRFAGLLSLTLGPPILEAIRAGCPLLSHLAVERVREELVKVLSGDPEPSTALSLYRSSGALAVLYPEFGSDGRVGSESADDPRDASGGPDDPEWDRALRIVDVLPRHRPLLRLAALLESAAGPADAILVRLRFSNADADRVSLLVRAGTTPPAPSLRTGEDARRWLSAHGSAILRDVARLWLAGASVDQASDGVGAEEVMAQIALLREVVRRREPLRVADLAVDGRDLMRSGIPGGPRIGEVLRGLLDRVLSDPTLNDREVLLGLVDEVEPVPEGPE